GPAVPDPGVADRARRRDQLPRGVPPARRPPHRLRRGPRRPHARRLREGRGHRPQRGGPVDRSGRHVLEIDPQGAPDMTVVSGVLLRTNKGHRYVGDPTGGAERYLRIDTDRVELGVELAEAYIEVHETPTETMGVTGQVIEADQIPAHGFGLADT